MTSTANEHGQAQYLADVFWRRWTKESSHTLGKEEMEYKEKESRRSDDLMSDGKFPRGTWPLARVVQGQKLRSRMRVCS